MYKDKYQEEYKKILQQQRHLNKKNNLIAFVRFLLIALSILSLLVGFFQQMNFLYAIAIICLIAFLLLIQYHEHLKYQYHYAVARSKVFQEHLQRIHNQWTAFDNDGHEWLDDKNYKAYDLDILAQNSLFQMISVAHTFLGKKKLAQVLTEDSPEYEKVMKRQRAIRDLSRHESFMLDVQTYGYMLPSNDEDIIQNFVNSELSFLKIPTILFIVSIITIFSGLCSLFTFGLPYTYIIAEMGVVLQLGLTFCLYKMHQQMFMPLIKISKSLDHYKRIFQLIEKEHFESQELQDLQQKICQKGQTIQGIQALSKIASRVNYRQNIFAFIILNALGLFDCFVRNQYIDWLQTHHQYIHQWFESLSLLEVYMSLCVLKVDGFDVSMPQISQQQNLSFHNLRHPLINPKKVVGNDFQMNQSVCIITGSNMSGKTTFMRTIGLNLVLAYAGGYVFADDMICSVMHIMTSMRVKDNVKEGISTFYSELLRIKEMIVYAQNNKPMICLIDEIFKGTNSLDRIAGAKATVDKLSQPYIMAFLTTHDIELCHEGQNAIYYHFDEYYENSHIYFDYQIKKGIIQTTNGQFLLKQLGIIE